MKPSGTRRRSKATGVIVALVLIAGALTSGQHGPRRQSHPVTATPTAAPSKVGSYWTTRADPVETPSAGRASPSDDSTSSSADPGLDQQDFDQICANGGCNPTTGSPTFENGGGLALPAGGD